jgi:hypothetical protein
MNQPGPMNQPGWVAPYDLDGERAKYGRLQRTLISILFPIVLIFLFLVCLGSGGLILALIVLVALAIIIAITVAIDRQKRGRLQGPATSKSSSIGQVLTQADPQYVWASVHQQLASMKISGIDWLDPITAEGRTGMSMGSYGERIVVRVAPSGQPGTGLVTAWSRPVYPLAWIDYARNQKAVNRVLAAVPGGSATSLRTTP